MELDAWLAGTDALASLDAAHAAAWASTDAELLRLCANRMAMLLGHEATLSTLADAELTAISTWPASTEFSEMQKAALDFTEQYVVDVASITDDQASALRQHMGDSEFATFVNALLVVEQRMSLELALAAAL